MTARLYGRAVGMLLICHQLIRHSAAKPRHTIGMMTRDEKINAKVEQLTGRLMPSEFTKARAGIVGHIKAAKAAGDDVLLEVMAAALVALDRRIALNKTSRLNRVPVGGWTDADRV